MPKPAPAPRKIARVDGPAQNSSSGSNMPASPKGPPPGRAPPAAEPTGLHPKKARPMIQASGQPGAFQSYFSAIQRQPIQEVSLIPNKPYGCLSELDEIIEQCPSLQNDEIIKQFPSPYMPTSVLFSDPCADDAEFTVWHFSRG